MTIYYIKNGGRDFRSGLSDVEAWGTIEKVNSFSFKDNDIISFKRNSIFDDTTLTLNSTSVGRSGIIIQDYGEGSKPWINGNSVKPIEINHALINLTLKNIDVSGSDTSGNRCHINNVNGIIIDGVDYNGHTGSSSYVRSTAMAVSYVDGNIEIKNCTIQNAMKDTFANTLSAWESNDAHGIIMYYAGDDNVKSSGTVSIHDNIIHDIYSDCMQIAGMNTSTNIYGNELYNFGENAIDMKHSKYIDFYQNVVYQNDYGAAGGSGYYGPFGIVSGASANWTTFMPSNNIIRENYIHTTKYGAIQTPGVNAIIKDNYIKDCTMGVIIANSGAKVHNNIFELTTGKPTVEPYASRWLGTMLSGIRIIYTPKADTLIYNNTFYISSSNHLYGIAVQADTNVIGTTIKNNIIYMENNSSLVYPLYIEDYDNLGNLPTVQNNLLYSTHSNRVKIEETPNNWEIYYSSQQDDWHNAGHIGSLFINPEFINISTKNFALQPSSPAIDAGIDVGLPFVGLAPDMGAIEYGLLDLCEGVECKDVCIENDLYSQKCDPVTGNCVTDTLIEANSSLCIISDPCEGITCSDVCIGNDLYSRKCIDGKCVTDQLLESDSLDCKLPTDEETIMKYITLGGLGLVAYIMLKMNKK